MFNFFKKKELPEEIRRALAPDPKRLARQKVVFLAAYEQAFANIVPERRPAFAAKLAAAVLVLFAAAGGMSAYADTANVPATSPLYSLKRLSETARLTFARQEDKPQLRAELAGRRTAEIDDLKEKKPESDLLPALAKDLHEEINNSVDEAEDNGLRDGKLNDFCGTLNAAVATTSAAIRDELSLHPETLEHFKNKCDGDHEDAKKEDNGGIDKNGGGDTNVNIDKDDNTDKNGENGAGDGSVNRVNKTEGDNKGADSVNKGKDDALELAPASPVLIQDAHRGNDRNRPPEDD